MKRTLLLLSGIALLVLVGGVSAVAGGHTAAKQRLLPLNEGVWKPVPAWAARAARANPNAGGFLTDGPFASMSPDSGTCGPNWAVDLFNRKFKILPQNPDGSWTVIETFASARFISLGDGQGNPASSPGACNGGPDNGNKLKEGVPGKFKGTFTIVIPPGFTFQGTGGCGPLEDWPQHDGAGSTPGVCTTRGWVTTHFPGVDYDNVSIPAFNFVYNALGKSWTNADTGNTGDICTSGSC